MESLLTQELMVDGDNNSQVRYYHHRRSFWFYLILLLCTVLIFLGVIIVVVLAFLGQFDKAAMLPTPVHPPIIFPVSSSPLGMYKSAAVACDNANCSDIGNKMLLEGGSAVDAAIAAMLCNSVVNMHSSGIGGGFFSVIWNGSAQVFDAYGVAPELASEALYLNYTSVLRSGKLSILVPGEVSGFYELHLRYGKLSWQRLFEPSIDLCRTGFYVGPSLAKGIQYVASRANTEEFPETQFLVDFLKNPETGRWYGEGDMMKCPKLATTFEMIAKNGGHDFYNGSIADMILEDFNELNVSISTADLTSYQVNTTKRPVAMQMQDLDLTLYTTHPSSSGVTSAFVLNILSNYNWTMRDSQDPLTYHRYLEALKFGWGQWSFLGDEAFINATEINATISKITSPDFGKTVSKRINDSYVLSLLEYGTYGTPPITDDIHHSTSHISVLDSEGNAVSLTSTINKYFGSFVMGPRSGIIFNNGMSNFFLNASSPDSSNSSTLPLPPYNFIRPGKRPMTTVSPLMFVDSNNTVKLIVGASGGSRIFSTVPYVALRVLWFKETVKQAVDAYRLQQTFIPDIVHYDAGWPSWLLDYLYSKGHLDQKQFSSISSSISQAVQRLDNGTIFAISDFRKGGGATAGF